MTTLNLEMDQATLSHELRIPLAGILGSVELLSMTNQLSQEEKEQIELIRQSGDRLLSIVNKLLASVVEEKNNKSIKQIILAVV